MDRVVVTGIGAASPLGESAEKQWQSLLEGRTAARSHSDLAEQGFRVTVACRADWLDCEPTRRGRALALRAAREAVESAGLSLPESTAVSVGSTMGESFAYEAVAEGAPLDLRDYAVDSFTRAVADAFGCRGTRASISAACAAGNHALASGFEAIRRGRAAAALVGGVDPFSRIAMVGFSRSRAMAPERCQPFDANRRGMLLGEGAGFLLLERERAALERGATPLACVVGAGFGCDAHHPTAPRADGSGMRRAMEQALAAAGVEPGQVDWVNAHGSGTRVSDAAEARALEGLFGASPPPMSASKGALGHGLGAASALEAIICVQGLRDGTLPPSPGHEQVDPACGIACTKARSGFPLRYVLNDAFAFGGLNSAVLFERWDGPC